MIAYNWQQKDWPRFTFNLAETEEVLLSFTEHGGHISGILKAIPDNIEIETIIDVMLIEAIKTSEIEGEYLSRKDVLSSIKKNLGLTPSIKPIKDKKAEGVGALMADVRKTYYKPLTKTKLFEWHKTLMGFGYNITAGKWRTHKEPMVVISGAAGKEKIHFEAPPSASVPKEMNQFIKWFNATAPGGKKEIKKAPVRSAIVHLYFESIHPFEDGNGRIGRALAEKALAQGNARPVMLSLSKTIEANKKTYYAELQKAQSSNHITRWIRYFIKVILDAQVDAEAHIDFTLKKVKFFDKYKEQLNRRQEIAIKRMFAEGAGGFKGGMNAGKYVSLNKTSKATATRDMQDLVTKGIFLPVNRGRSAAYEINL